MTDPIIEREKELELTEAEKKVEAFASQLHDEWRQPRWKEESQSYDTRVKVLAKTEDGKDKWFDENKVPPTAQELKRQDIANTDYKNLDPHWQFENKSAAQDSMKILMDADEAGKNFDEKFIEDASAKLHEEWLSRNGSWAPPEQNKPYPELSEEEKEKDRTIIRKAIDVYRSNK